MVCRVSWNPFNGLWGLSGLLESFKWSVGSLGILSMVCRVSWNPFNGLLVVHGILSMVCRVSWNPFNGLWGSLRSPMESFQWSVGSLGIL